MGLRPEAESSGSRAACGELLTSKAILSLHNPTCRISKAGDDCEQRPIARCITPYRGSVGISVNIHRSHRVTLFQEEDFQMGSPVAVVASGSRVSIPGTILVTRFSPKKQQRLKKNRSACGQM